MAKTHFYDIECLSNIFTLTNYLPEENRVDQYYLADPKLMKQIAVEPNLLKQLTDRVNLRNHNFTPDRHTQNLGNGTVHLYDLSRPKAVLRLAREFGVSTSKNINDPTDATSNYPAGLRLVCDTDLSHDQAKWTADEVSKRYKAKLSNHNCDQNIVNLPINQYLNQLNYHEYDENKDPYLFGYNSDNYDLTILAIFFEDVFTEITGSNHANVDFCSHNDTGYHYFEVTPPKPQILRKINNYMFSSNYKDNMPSILFKPPVEDVRYSNRKMKFRTAFQIRRNMLQSGRHLDVSKLNEKMSKVGLKRLLGMMGYQILESDKLKPGTDTIDNMDMFYELLAYNASDCINLAALFYDDRGNDHRYYVSQFELKKSMLKTYPMTVYQKRTDAYAPDIAPDKVKKRRMLVDSSSAQIATNVVCPYGHLNDIAKVSYKYPEIRKSKEVGIPQFDVLKQTKDFFYQRVYLPASKTNPEGAKKALASFKRITDFYQYIQSKNFNDADNFYKHQLLLNSKNQLPQIKQAIEDSRSKEFLSFMSSFNSFDLLSINHQREIKGQVNGQDVMVSADFVKSNKIVAVDANKQYPDQNKLRLGSLVQYIKEHIKPGRKRANTDLALSMLAIYQKYQTQAVNTADLYQAMADEDKPQTNEEKFEENLDYQKFSELCRKFTKIVFDREIYPEVYSQQFAKNWDSAKLFIARSNFAKQKVDIKPLYQLRLRPYTPQDLPKGNYCIPFFDKNANPTSGYALFSTGGVHGAEYNKALYEQDNRETDNTAGYQQESLFDLTPATQVKVKKTKNKSKTKYELFIPGKGGNYELNKRYTYTSADPSHHEDFSSYYPSLCRMLNVYWNDGIGKDIYGEVYDRKEKLGTMMKDPKYTPEQRGFYHDQRQGTKLILNSTTGKGDSHGQNSPIQMNNNIMAMRIIGQMFTWRIGQAQALAGAKIISTNTDGLYTVLADKQLNDQILKDEAKEIHVRIDPEELFLVTKDANNRVEEDVKTYKINVPSGGSLAAFNGPVPTHSLAHPAAIDRALGIYMQTITKPGSPYYDKTMMKPFNKTLGMHILHNLLGEVKTKQDKEELLRYLQNVIASSPGSDRYIFTSKKDYGTSLNEKILLDHKSNTTDFNLAFNGVPKSDFQIMQHYNRVLYVKPNSMPDIRHIYVASGRKVSDPIRASRKRQGIRVYNNSEIAEYILQNNGVAVNHLNKNHKEAQVVKLPSLPSSWPVVLQNASWASLTEKELDELLDNIDYDHYLELLMTTYIDSWCNNVDYRKQYDRLLKKKYV